MVFPKYFRPIRDVDNYVMSGTEKAVRTIVFTPLLMLFGLPTALGVAFFALTGALGLMFIITGAENVFSHPEQYYFEGMILLAIVALIIFSNIIARSIRRYFLPFG